MASDGRLPRVAGFNLHWCHEATAVAASLLTVAVLGSSALLSGPRLGSCGPPEKPQATGLEIRDDEDDPAVWTVVNSFQRSPSPTNTKKAFEILDQILDKWDSHPAGVATTILQSIGDHRVASGREYLVRFLQVDPERPSAAFIASAAALALGDLGGAGAFEALQEAANHRSDEALSSVAVALGSVNDSRGVPTLEKLLQNGASNVRRRALPALAKYCSLSSRPLVLNALTDGDAAIRGGATWWLFSCGTSRDAPYMSQQLTDPDPLVRSNALKGLIRVNSKHGCSSVDRLQRDPSMTVREQAEAYRRICGVQ